ncbi:MAG TPA: DUF721 domain-containing protein [Nitrospirae bacterium]|nr:hypothetical protein BMS3Bbin08_01538 [bacterium BMS3Bbin08]HDK16656.1 DUF721 domain-containing protein [Nitrospirota bacterium]
MQRAGTILKKFIGDYGLEAGLTFTRICDQWTKLVGETIAAHTYPDIVKGNTIFITVDTPQWMHHLSFYKQDICEKLRSYRITDVRFKLGKLPAADPALKGSDDSRVLKTGPLSGADARYIENTVKSIKDDDLKRRLRELLEHALRSERVGD